MNREDMIAIAKTYLIDGLILHQPQNALLADDCVRIENGMETGGSAAVIRQLLTGDNYLINDTIENERWVVEGAFADVWYDLKLRGGAPTMSISSRFEIADGKIKKIEVLVDAGALHSVVMESIESLRTDR